MADSLTSEQRSACMRAVRSKDTAPERAVRSILHHLGYRFALHRADLPGRPDIVMPVRRVVVFVHGCFWHGHSCGQGRRAPSTNARYWKLKILRNRARDRRVLTALRRLGWRVLVVWECQIRDANKLGERLSAFLLHRRDALTGGR